MLTVEPCYNLACCFVFSCLLLCMFVIFVCEFDGLADCHQLVSVIYMFCRISINE